MCLFYFFYIFSTPFLYFLHLRIPKNCLSHWENRWCWGQLLCSRTWNIYPAAGSMSGCYLTVVLFKQYFHHITYKVFQSIGLKYQAVLLLRRANNGIYPKPRYPKYTSFYIEYVSAKFHQNISFGRHDNIYIYSCFAQHIPQIDLLKTMNYMINSVFHILKTNWTWTAEYIIYMMFIW